MNTRAVVLLVEDEPGLQRIVGDRLVAEGYQVLFAGDGRSAARRWKVDRPALVILDVMLPDADGIHLLREFRVAGDNTPVIVLTARGESTDKIVALGIGADDYVTKPFDLGELVARVGAHIRRSQQQPSPGTEKRVRCGPWEIDFDAERVVGERGDVELSQTEYRLLSYLARNRNRTVTREELLAEVWHYAPDAATRTVDQHVAQLRAKLEEDRSRPRYLLTVHQQGYRLKTS